MRRQQTQLAWQMRELSFVMVEKYYATTANIFNTSKTYNN